MPPTDHPHPDKTLQEVVDSLGVYPVDAFRFVEEGLSFTVERLNPAQVSPGRTPAPGSAASRTARPMRAPEPKHISGQQLCEGLRDYALSQWGMMARTVLIRWRVNCTLDFGKIVYALIDAGHMQKTDQDSVDDFRDVYEFKAAFERDYRIEPQS